MHNIQQISILILFVPSGACFPGHKTEFSLFISCSVEYTDVSFYLVNFLQMVCSGPFCGHKQHFGPGGSHHFSKCKCINIFFWQTAHLKFPQFHMPQGKECRSDQQGHNYVNWFLYVQVQIFPIDQEIFYLSSTDSFQVDVVGRVFKLEKEKVVYIALVDKPTLSLGSSLFLKHVRFYRLNILHQEYFSSVDNNDRIQQKNNNDKQKQNNAHVAHVAFFKFGCKAIVLQKQRGRLWLS